MLLVEVEKKRLKIRAGKFLIVAILFAAIVPEKAATFDSSPNENPLHWYVDGALEGSAASQFQVGTMFRDGKGTAPDLKEAANWFRLAALQNYPPAQFALAELYRLRNHMEEVDDVNVLLAYAWFHIAAVNGLEQALLARDRMRAVMTAEQISRANWNIRQIWEEIDSNEQ